MGAKMTKPVLNAIHALGYISTEEAAEKLGVTISAVSALVKRGTLSGRKFMKYVAVSPSSVEREVRRRNPPRPPKVPKEGGRSVAEYGRVSYEKLLADIRAIVRHEVRGAFIDHARSQLETSARWPLVSKNGALPKALPQQGELALDKK